MRCPKCGNDKFFEVQGRQLCLGCGYDDGMDQAIDRKKGKMEITKRMVVTIKEEELVGLVVKAIYPDVSPAMGKEWTLYRALSHLTGCTDVEAVRAANRLAKLSCEPTITTDDFRKWLPKVLSKAFAKLLGQGEGEEVGS